MSAACAITGWLREEVAVEGVPKNRFVSEVSFAAQCRVYARCAACGGGGDKWYGGDICGLGPGGRALVGWDAPGAVRPPQGCGVRRGATRGAGGDK